MGVAALRTAGGEPRGRDSVNGRIDKGVVGNCSVVGGRCGPPPTLTASLSKLAMTPFPTILLGDAIVVFAVCTLVVLESRRAVVFTPRASVRCTDPAVLGSRVPNDPTRVVVGWAAAAAASSC